MLAFDLQPRLDPPLRDGGERDGPPAEPIPIVPARGHLIAWIPQFAQKVAEVVGGDRPASQLVRWTTKEVIADLRYRASLAARSGAYEPGLGRNQPVRPRIFRWHFRPVSIGIVEATVNVKFGEGHRALALRFEQVGDSWICTAIDFGPYR
ncbi:hypothetical protein J2S40_002999 [Nocardioides luteus]|nr:Rv3235 family protein [Nocardioides luteus]MDR7311941.1 hypothetical protein [Nocardioides luteus]